MKSQPSQQSKNNYNYFNITDTGQIEITRNGDCQAEENPIKEPEGCQLFKGGDGRDDTTGDASSGRALWKQDRSCCVRLHRIRQDQVYNGVQVPGWAVSNLQRTSAQRVQLQFPV